LPCSITIVRASRSALARIFAEISRRWFARWLGAWENYTARVEELIDAGDRVVVVHHERGRGRGSGVEVDNRSANVFDVSCGKIVRRRPFPDRSQALDAVGLLD